MNITRWNHTINYYYSLSWILGAHVSIWWHWYMAYDFEEITIATSKWVSLIHSMNSPSEKQMLKISSFRRFRMFRRKFKSFGEFWATCSAKKKYHLLYNFIAELSRLIGCRFFIDGVVYWWSYTAYVLVLIYWLLATYTIVYHTMNGHFLRCLPCLCSFGVSVSVRL